MLSRFSPCRAFVVLQISAENSSAFKSFEVVAEFEVVSVCVVQPADWGNEAPDVH